MLDHLSIQCADLAASAAFYDAVLVPIGGQRIVDFGEVIGYGTPPRPDFWIGAQSTGDGFRESHIAFVAPSRKAVRAFVEAAVATGAEVLHAAARLPRVPPELLRGVRPGPRRQQRGGGLLPAGGLVASPHGGRRPHRRTTAASGGRARSRHDQDRLTGGTCQWTRSVLRAMPTAAWPHPPNSVSSVLPA